MSDWQAVFYEGVDRAGQHYAAYAQQNLADSTALQAKQGQILQALEACARYRRAPDTIFTITQALHGYMLRSGQLETWLDYVSMALATAARREDRPVQFALYLNQEELYHRLGRREEQAAVLANLARLVTETNRDDWSAQQRLRRARHANMTGAGDVALQAAEAAIQLAQRGALPDVEAEARYEAGLALWYHGEFSAAQAQQSAALQASAALNRPDLEAKIHRGLAMIAWGQDDFAAAEGHHARALTLYQQLGDRSGEAKSLYNLGFYAQQRHDYPAARRMTQQALAVFRALKDRQSEGMVLNVLGILDHDEGRLPTAAAYFRSAAETADAVADRQNATNGRCNLALVLGRLGDFQAALALLDEVLVAYQQMDARRFECLALSYKCLLHYWQQAYQTAEVFGRQCLALAEEIGAPSLQGNALTILGHTLLAGAGEPAGAALSAAAASYQQAAVLGEQLNMPEITMEARAGLARIYLQTAKSEAALALVDPIYRYLQASAFATPLFEPLRVLFTCYQVWQAAGDARAAEALNQAQDLLRQQADRIADERLRASFLASPVHQEIQRQAAAAGHQ